MDYITTGTAGGVVLCACTEEGEEVVVGPNLTLLFSLFRMGGDGGAWQEAWLGVHARRRGRR
jgi:hypothetical protein